MAGTYTDGGHMIPKSDRIVNLTRRVPHTKQFGGRAYSAFHASYSKYAQEQTAKKMRAAGAYARIAKSKVDGRDVYTIYTRWV